MPFTDPTTTVPGSDVTGPIERDSPDGGKIVLDTDGAIKVYDADGNPTNYIGGADNIVWNNSGWDPDGTPDGEFVGMWVGNLILGVGNPETQDLSTMGLLGVNGNGFGMGLQSPAQPSGGGGFEDHLFVNLSSGKAGGQSGTVNCPQMQVSGDLAVSGALVKSEASFDTTAWRNKPETWHAATPNSGWSTTTSIGSLTGVPSLRYRHGVQDTVILEGSFVCASTNTSSFAVTTLPGPTNDGSGHIIDSYRPAANSAPFPVTVRTTAGATSTQWMYLSSAGNLNINSQTGSSLVAGATYSLPRTEVSLNNIP